MNLHPHVGFRTKEKVIQKLMAPTGDKEQDEVARGAFRTIRSSIPSYPNGHENLKLLKPRSVHAMINQKVISGSMPFHSLASPPPINTRKLQQSHISLKFTSRHRPSAKSGKIGIRECLKVKKMTLCDVLASIRSKYPTASRSYSGCIGPKVVKNQKLKRVQREIIKAKGHGEEKKRVNLLSSALIADEDVMDKEVESQAKPPPKKLWTKSCKNQGVEASAFHTTSNSLLNGADHDTREAGVDSSMHRLIPELEHF
ncbi:hypothetical protein Tco_0067277 [Tanacetum coccineum]